MSTTHSSPLQPQIESRILFLREQRVMLDTDLATLYGVETRSLVQAVKRNLGRFPVDFMFQLTSEEWSGLRSQFVISSRHGGRRYAPYAFTEQGVAMLSSVLGSAHAIAINIEIMRTFVKVRGMAATQQELAKLDELLAGRQLAERTSFDRAFIGSNDGFGVLKALQVSSGSAAAWPWPQDGAWRSRCLRAVAASKLVH